MWKCLWRQEVYLWNRRLTENRSEFIRCQDPMSARTLLHLCIFVRLWWCKHRLSIFVLLLRERQSLDTARTTNTARNFCTVDTCADYTQQWVPYRTCLVSGFLHQGPPDSLTSNSPIYCQCMNIQRTISSSKFPAINGLFHFANKFLNFSVCFIFVREWIFSMTFVIRCAFPTDARSENLSSTSRYSQ